MTSTSAPDRTPTKRQAQFLAALVAGHQNPVSYDDLQNASVVLMAGFEPEEESPIVFLRLRKAVRKSGLRIATLAPFASRGATKLGARLVLTPTGTGSRCPRPTGRRTVTCRTRRDHPRRRALAASLGALSAAARLAKNTGARLAWVPRRPGNAARWRPGVRPTCSPVPAQRRILLHAKRFAEPGTSTPLPENPGRDGTGILTATLAGDLDTLLIGGVEPRDLPDPDAALAAIRTAKFVVSLGCASPKSPDLRTSFSRWHPLRRSRAHS